MTSTDFRDTLEELMNTVGDFPVVFWMDGEPMPIIGVTEDGDGLCLDATPDEFADSLLASDIIAAIENIGYEMTDVYATYEFEGYEGFPEFDEFKGCTICEPVGLFGADVETHTIDVCP